MGPLRFEPILKRLIWGGRRLETVLGKPLPPGEDYAESWEIADHRDDVSRLIDPNAPNQTLRSLLERDPSAILGEAKQAARFPLLVKFLDAHDVLSVQVHPDDELGARLANDRGKTEAWFILHAEPGSLIYAGLQPGVTRESFAAAIASGSVEPLLHRFEARPGQCVFIPAGTVHAIGAGIVLAEVQQMSDATFRVYDWGRVAADGQPRKLHIAEALESINFAAGPVDPVVPESLSNGRTRLVRCDYFELDSHEFTQAIELGENHRFTIVIGVEGRMQVGNAHGSIPLKRGETALLPAAAERCTLRPDGRAVVLICAVP